jgi:hypothetical protein
MDILGGISRFAGKAFGGASPQASMSAPQPVHVPSKPQIHKGVERLHDVFTSTQIRDRSSGAITPMTRQGASGLAGNYVVETGDPTLTNTDVIEKNNGNKGRGLAQYTDARRGPYDAARNDYISSGGDPNDIEFQIDHAAREYAGDFDQDGKSLVGYTGALEGETDGMSAGESATHLRKDFFRPSVPHNDRRVEAAESIDSSIQQRDERLEALSHNANLRNSSMAHVGHRGADGRYWGGDDYGWQSPESFKQLVGY